MDTVKTMVLLFFVGFSMSSFAGLYKCKTDEGKIEYRDKSCAATSSAQDMNVHINRPDAVGAQERYKKLMEQSENIDEKRRRWAEDRNKTWELEKQMKYEAKLERERLCAQAKGDYAKYEAEIGLYVTPQYRNHARKKAKAAKERVETYCD